MTASFRMSRALSAPSEARKRSKVRSPLPGSVPIMSALIEARIAQRVAELRVLATQTAVAYAAARPAVDLRPLAVLLASMPRGACRKPGISTWPGLARTWSRRAPR
jgi:hypothetical protein